MAEMTRLLDQVHRSLAPRLSAAGFKLTERDVSPAVDPSWIDYRSLSGVATYILSLTATTDGHLLAEFWCSLTGGRGLKVLGQAEWRGEPQEETVLLAAVVAEVERWLADQRGSSA